MTIKEHENRLYQFLVPIVEKRLDDKIELLHRPDELDRKAKAIDFVSRGKEGIYLIEHTYIENQKDRKLLDALFNKLLGPIEKQISGNFGVPGYYYDFFIEMTAVRGAKNTKAIQENLEAWIRSEIEKLKPEEVITAIPKGVPFSVRLVKQKAEIKQIEGKFLVGRMSPDRESAKKMRSERIKTAFTKKFPKLEAAKSVYANSRSILFLESNDIALSNHLLIWDAVEEALKEYQDAPDDIYLIEMEIESQPTVWILKEGRKLFPKIRGHGPHYVNVE
jgi:hypothetical protein